MIWADSSGTVPLLNIMKLLIPIGVTEAERFLSVIYLRMTVGEISTINRFIRIAGKR